MGGILKRQTISGRTLQEAFKRLQEIDRQEHGNDYYSGGWNNCPSVREVSSKSYDDTDDLSKGSGAIAKCIRQPKVNTNTVKTTVDRFPNKGARKWVTMYVAKSSRYETEHYMSIKDESQAEVIRKARIHVENNPKAKLTIVIEKHLIKQEAKVAEIKYKPSTTEKDGEWEIFAVVSY